MKMELIYVGIVILILGFAILTNIDKVDFSFNKDKNVNELTPEESFVGVNNNYEVTPPEIKKDET